MNTVCVRCQCFVVTPWRATMPDPIVATAWIFLSVASSTGATLPPASGAPGRTQAGNGGYHARSLPIQEHP